MTADPSSLDRVANLLAVFFAWQTIATAIGVGVLWFVVVTLVKGKGDDGTKTHDPPTSNVNPQIVAIGQAVVKENASLFKRLAEYDSSAGKGEGLISNRGPDTPPIGDKDLTDWGRQLRTGLWKMQIDDSLALISELRLLRAKLARRFDDQEMLYCPNGHGATVVTHVKRYLSCEVCRATLVSEPPART